jgi:hypothetical protein
VPIHTGSYHTVISTVGVDTSIIGPRWKVGSIKVGEVGRREVGWEIKKTGSEGTGDRGN